MAQRNRWSSVCHSTAQHAASGLCSAPAHLGHTLRKLGGRMVLVDLLRDGPEPRFPSRRYHLDMSLRSLRRRFAEIAESDGLDLADLSEAKVLFQFSFGNDEPCRVVHAKLVSRDGRIYARAVDYLGVQFAPRSDF